MKKKCDRKICSENLFRGKNVCEGFNFIEEGWRVKQRSYFVCPCACHSGITQEQTLKAIEAHKNPQPNYE